jgi:hypothetical protein
MGLESVLNHFQDKKVYYENETVNFKNIKLEIYFFVLFQSDFTLRVYPSNVDGQSKECIFSTKFYMYCIL